jgi:hypothetical protein
MRISYTRDAALGRAYGACGGLLQPRWGSLAIVSLALSACSEGDKESPPEDTGSEWSMVEIEGPFTEIEGEDNSLCVLQADGLPRCFGYMAEPELPVAIHGLRVGDGAAAGLDADGAIVYWGPYTGIIPSGTGFRSVELNASLSCAVNVDGGVECWDGLYADFPEYDFQRVSHGGGPSYSGIGDFGLARWDSLTDPVITPGEYVDLRADLETCTLSAAGEVRCTWSDYPEGVLVAEGADTFSIDDDDVCWTSAGMVDCRDVFPSPSGAPAREETAHAPDRVFSRTAQLLGALCGLTDAGDLVCWGNDQRAWPYYFPGEDLISL